MGLKYYSNELNNYGNIQPFYANTCVLYNKKHPFSSQSSSSETSIRKKCDGIIYHFEKNIYANITKLPIDISDDTNYSTSITSSFKTDIARNSQILDENNNNRIYQNVKLDPTSPKNVNPSSPIYINLKQHADDPPIAPTLLSKNDQNEKIELSSIHLIEIKQIDIETNVLEKCSNTKTKQTIKKLEVNMAPNCNEKSDLYRTKIPSTITRILPSLRQRRTLHRSRRYRRRSSTPFRSISNSNPIRRQQQRSNSNTSVHHPMISNNQRKRSSKKSVTNQLYNEIQQPILSDNQSINSYYTEEIFESPVQFDGTTPDEMRSSHPTENEESIHQDKTPTEEEELRPHKTFEDFLLRRPSKSSCSTLASVTNTLISEEIPLRSPSFNRHSSPGITLSLDKNDVDFIHDILHRSHGDQRVSNRITALREAYIRAGNKRNDLLQTKTIPQNKKKVIMKQSMITSKIRNELEKYDELPVHRKTNFHDNVDDDDDDTYSANDDYRYHHRRLPPIPSTTNRIRNFVTTLKRQLQKNFHDIRSKMLIESTSNSSRRRHILHNSSGSSRQYRHRPKTSHTNTRYSIEHSYPIHQHQCSRTYSDPSYHHLSHRPRTFRVTPHLP